MKQAHILSVIINIEYNENDDCTAHCAVVEYTNGLRKQYPNFKSIPHNVFEWCEKHEAKRTIRSQIDGYKVIYEYNFNRGVQQ